jgi:membrane-bound metal-dependent hydrolase YbcI (DUF457 family)
MPVLGHAFAGLAIGMTAERAQRKDRAASSWFVPLVVTLSYLPDLSTHLLKLAGWNEARVFSHSLLFAVAASLAAVPLLRRMSGLSSARAFLIAAACVAGHDLLDLAQASDRQLWWPFSARRSGFALLPTGSVSETLIFGSAFAIFALVHYLRRGSRQETPPTNNRWPARMMVLALMLAAGATQYARSVRESQFENAHTLLEAGNYPAALAYADDADKWPSVAKRGRTDYIRGAAYAGMGDAARAEYYYLRSYEAEPGYFWLVVDLADFYSSSPRSRVERQRAAEPYLRQLRTEFTSQAQQSQVISRIERQLSAGSDQTPSLSSPKMLSPAPKK